MQKSIQDYKKEATLNKVFRYPEGLMSRKEWLKLMRVKGWVAEESNIRNYAAEEKLSESVEWQRKNVPLGNPNYPSTKAYFEDKARLEAGIFKTVYSLKNGNSSYDITKTEYEHFKSMELEDDILTQKNDLSYRIEAGIATDEEVNEAMDKELNFFSKYAND